MCEINLENLVENEFLRKTVTISIIDSKPVTGKVLTIDPITKTFALTSKLDNKVQVRLVPGWAIRNVQVLDNDDTTSDTDDIHIPLMPRDSCAETKSVVMQYLQKNSVEVISDGDNIALKHEPNFVIFPPYNRNTCKIDNFIILEKIQKLLDNITFT